MLSVLDFNTLVDEILLDKEHIYTIMSIRRIGRSARKLDLVAKFILWFDKYELGGHDNDDVDDIIGDPNYIST